MKLALGTVQFGLDYGIANKHGQVPYDEAASILSKARDVGLDMLDTAMGYGNSEQRLGELNVEDWNVVSKMSTIPDGCSNIIKWVNESVSDSLGRLNVKSLYALLLHRPQQLLEKDGVKLFNALQKVKKSGLVKNIGISIYEPVELDNICSRFDIDIVQAPFNIFDDRLINSGWMKRLKELNIELHVRSVFLQGLLLMKPSERPEKFNRWNLHWNDYDAWLKENKLEPIQACLRYALSFNEIDKVIVGVDTLSQLEEVIAASNGMIPNATNRLRSDDVDLINPARWNLL